MEESRTQRLQELLRRLGKAVHGSVVRSEEVRTCLDELHDEGWRAVMLLETSLACGESGSVEVDSWHPQDACRHRGSSRPRVSVGRCRCAIPLVTWVFRPVAIAHRATRGPRPRQSATANPPPDSLRS